MFFPSYCVKCFCREKYLLSTLCSLPFRSASLVFVTRKMSGSFEISGHQSKDHLNTINFQYEKAVEALNGLQSNAEVIKTIIKDRQANHSQSVKSDNIFLTELYLQRAGITLSDLDHLSVIHIAGTKGKGSTCAFVESIVREHGYKTGFFSSPHLVAVRERIRINGITISKKEFSYHFWEVYDSLKAQMATSTDMPHYFKFLTVLALKIFLKEDVDVAIIEVGIGGEYDSTNVIRRPVVCGITSLDLDHIAILGNTIEIIAWNKAGIMKPHAPAFTVEQNVCGAFPVLQSRAAEKKIPLCVVPPLEDYDWGGRPIQLGLSGYVQFMNASLALQLAHHFINTRGSEPPENCTQDLCIKPFTLSQEDILGLQNVKWPGRSQVLVKGNMTFFLDGAHTLLSIQSCVKWFNKVSMQHTPPDEDVFKVLIFNVTGDRECSVLLSQLVPCNFDLVIFTTNLVTGTKDASSDVTNFTVTDATQIARCEKLRKSWLSLTEKNTLSNQTNGNGGEVNKNSHSDKCMAFFCIHDVLLWLSCGRTTLLEGQMTAVPDFPPPMALKKASNVQVLITGSLYLVGGFLGFLDPTLSQDRDDTITTSMADLVKKKYEHAQSDTTGAR